jgi:hypothetical protein
MSSRDQQRYDALRKLGCIACHIDGYRGVPSDIHHLVDKGYRKHSGGNQATIPLCPWHHRSVPVGDFTLFYMRSVRGPSMALESKAFKERYGSQRELLAKVNELIGSASGIGT